MGKVFTPGDIRFEARAVGGKIELTFVITVEPTRYMADMTELNLEVEDAISRVEIDLGA